MFEIFPKTILLQKEKEESKYKYTHKERQK